MEAENTVNIEVFKGLVTSAPAILEQNRESVGKAEMAGNSLITAVNTLLAQEAGKPNFEARKALDEKLSKYLVRVNETIKSLKDRRTPITGLFDDFKRMFTVLEAKIDPKNDTFPGKIQNIRNRWAADQAQENQRIQAEQTKLRNIEAEKIRVKAEIELQLRKYFLNFVEAEQNAFIKSFNDLELQSFDFESERLINYKPVYPSGHFVAFKPTIYVSYIDQIEIPTIAASVMVGKFQEFETEFVETMLGIKEIFVEKLASKKAELQEISNANQTELLRLSKEKAEREAAEAERLAKENADKKAAATLQAETVQQVAQTNMMFETEAAQIQTTNVKEGVEITVLNATGWLQIVSFYFQKEGLKRLPEELAKMKLDQMRTWCEKHYMKTSERIQSIALEYKDVYKAVNKK